MSPDSLPTPGELVALCGLFFVAAMIYIGVRFVRETKAQRASEAATRAEIQRRAALAGRTFENGMGETEWIQTGATAAGHAWTLRHVIAQVRTLDRQGRTGVARDTIQGQKLEWRCPAMAGAEAFTFYSFRVAEDNDPEEMKFDPEDRLWWKWRVKARDEALARRAFSPAVCALIAQLPEPYARNTREQHRTRITLGGEGLVATLGAYFPSADVVDLWIELCETLAREIAGAGTPLDLNS